MTKLVGNLTQIPITFAAAALQPQAGKLFFSSESCFIFCPESPILSFNIRDFYVE
jgi:hypothetical protein